MSPRFNRAVVALVLAAYGTVVVVAIWRWDLPSIGLGAALLIALALVLELVAKSLFGVLFGIGLIRQDHRVALRLSVWAAFVGTAVARLLPGGSALSPSAMAWTVRAEDDGAAGAALRATVTSYGGLLVISGIALGWSASVSDMNFVAGSAGSTAAGVIAVGTLIMVGSRWLGAAIGAMPMRLRRHFGVTADGGRLTAPETMLIFIRLILEATVLWLVLVAFGIELGVSEAALAFGTAKVIGSIPITPGGIGFVEGGLFGVLATMGYAYEDAVASILVYQGLDYWAVSGIGLFFAGRLSREARVH